MTGAKYQELLKLFQRCVVEPPAREDTGDAVTEGAGGAAETSFESGEPTATFSRLECAHTAASAINTGPSRRIARAASTASSAVR